MRFAALVLIVSAVVGCSSYEGVAASNEQSGNAIIAAIEKYRAVNGSYPPTLSALVPKYLPSIPVVSHGSGTWEYVIDAEGFSLGFSCEGRHWNGSYHSAGGKWYFDDK